MPALAPDVLIVAAHTHAEHLRKLGVEPQRAHLDQPGAARDVQREHCLWMLEEVVALVGEGDYGKAERWLCFAQGVLWSLGHHSIDDCRDLNRGDTQT